MRINYVLGFLFTEDLKSVILIKKNKPRWQAGLLNGIGGKIEENEHALDAMDREMQEETGLLDVEWKEFGRMSNVDFVCILFAAISENASGAHTMEQEEVRLIEVSDILRLPETAIENLRWLICAAIDYLEDGRPEYIQVSYPANQ